MTAEAGVLAESRAVLIGVSAYEYAEFPPIRAARNSLQAVQSLLADPALCGWPPGQITVIENPASAADLANQVADLAESTTGVLLLYYVGHGALSPRGELCLTVTSTRPSRPKYSGLAWENVAEILRACPARARLVILDCCFAGQVIEALSGDGGPGLADIAHVDGVYTLTATTRNRTAHVPPPDQQDIACTSFTGELRDLIHSGIPGKPAWLTFNDIYPELRRRLQVKGLPRPSQCGTDTAHQFPFTVNAAYARDAGDSAGEAAQTVTAPVRNDQAMRLVRDAERLAWSITNKKLKASALASVAQAVAASDPDRAEGLARSITDEPSRASALASVAQAVAASDPGRAARLIDDAEHVARSITGEKWEAEEASALASVAQAVAASDPDRAARLIDDAGHLAAPLTSGQEEVIVVTSPGRFWEEEEVIASVAQAVAASDPDRAERLARSIIEDRREASSVLASVAQAVAASDPDRAEGLARSITDEPSKASALASVAQAVAASDPDRAERLARSITNKKLKASALASVAQAVAASDPDRAEGLARSITDEPSRASALASVAQAVAASDPGRAARLIDDAEHVARSITGEKWEAEEASALASVAQAVAASDPDRAEGLARSITDEPSKASALASVAQAVAASDPGRAERLARSITSPELKVSALVRIARTGLRAP